MRERAWGLRENFTIADALFVALAERLGEPLATKDLALAAAVAGRGDLDVAVRALGA
jgi:predicted nucleic acid-binding protein